MKPDKSLSPLRAKSRRIRQNIALCLGTAVLCLTGFLLVSAFTEADSDRDSRPPFNEIYRIASPELPDTLDFAGEPVPLDFYLCRERLDRELLVNIFWQSNQLLWLKRAPRYFPVIEPILRENGIPDDFKFLCLVESGLMNVVSPAKAAGFWQLLAGTARDLGLEVNDYVDERYNLKKATQAACRYLNMLYGYYGSWTLAAAAYNTGKNNIDYHIQTQEVVSYYHMYLPEETTRYLYRILAEKIIFGNPEAYGFYVSPEETYPPLATREIPVDTTIRNLFDFARRQNLSYQMLKLYNPWLRERQLPNRSGRTYLISLPDNADETLPEGISRLPMRIPESDPATDSGMISR